MFRIAVCDDEPVAVAQLTGKIKKYLPECEVCGFFSGRELLAAQEDFALYFLDIQMENMNGIETAKRLRQRENDSPLVFITAAKEYVFEAFDVAAMHYLLKPVQEEKLKEVLLRAKKESEKKRAGERKIAVKTKEKTIAISLTNVFYFENELRKIVAHTKNGNITFYGKMAEMERQAGEEFYRIHRGYLVNLAYVAEYDGSSVTLTNGERLYLAKERYPEFVRKYMRYLREGGGDDA